jgi:endonuclease I
LKLVSISSGSAVQPQVRTNVAKTRQPERTGNSETGDLPAIEDLFKGSKPRFGKSYDRFIASTQVPHTEASSEYYDAAKDAQTAAAYYAAIPGGTTPQQRTEALRRLVKETHHPEPRGYHYVVAKSLYSEVDRQPDGTVRSVYSQEPLKVLRYPDVSLQTLSQNDLSAIAGASAAPPEVIGAWLAFQKGAASLNCEHVVPQSFFNEREPMRSDLHHLYACEIAENSRRGDTRYGDYQPVGGKGEVARATLYFMLRYPEVKLPYGADAVKMLKQWAVEDPPDEHERHRNMEIQKAQGNRNPFIDHPEWVADFQP